MQIRFASSVDMGPCQPARFWKKSFVYLKAVALLCVITGENENEEEESDFLVAAALSKIDAGVALLVREVGVALLLFF